MKRIELLSPAGNFECLKAAINNGADAVYLGGSNFSARAFADNFDNEKIVEAIKYAHLRNVKVYVTINTLLNEYEIDNAYNFAKFLYENNVDAILIQDLGLFYRLRTDFPDFELHASTQLHIHNLQGVKNAKELGFKRVVLARESSLELIRECSKEDIEIECFVHGAICVSYSGQCLMSSVTKNRSANKGMCAQMCRLKYDLYDDNKKIETDTKYLLSPKDMFLLNDIPSLIEAGVSSLKIEGRMKSSAYVGYVTRCYREAIDAYYNNQKYIVTDEIINNLKALYNRGFTNTYLLNDSKDLFSNSRPNHMGIEIGEVIKVLNSKVFIKLNNDINQFDGIRIISNIDTGLILNMLKVNGKLVNKAKKNDIVEITVKDKVKVGDKVIKTLDYNFENSINKTLDKKIHIYLDIHLKVGDTLKVVAQFNNEHYEYVSTTYLEKAINMPISDSDIIDCFNKVDIHPYVIDKYTINLDNVFIPLKKLNEIRREFYSSFDEYRLNKKISKEIVMLELKEIVEYNQPSYIEEKDYYINPVVNTDSIYRNGFVSEFGGLLLKEDKNAYYTLNTSNSYAFEFLLRLGFKNIVLSTELNYEQILELLSNFYSRNKLCIKPYMLIKGRRTLMYLNRNPFGKYDVNYKNTYISDGTNIYRVQIQDNIVEIIEDTPVNRQVVDGTLPFTK